MARRPLTALCLAVICAALASCGSGSGSDSAGSDSTGGTATTTPPQGLSPAMTDYGLMRDKVVLGLAKDFRAGTHAGPGGYALCVRLGMRRALSSDQLNRLVAIYRRPDGQAFAAQALSRIAAPIGAECGGARFIPEPIAASEALAGRYPLSRLMIAARRLGITYGPYLGVTCHRAGHIGCEEVGIDVVLRRDAKTVTAWVGRRRLALRTPGEHNGVAARDWVGFVRGVGLNRPGSPFRIPDNGRNRGTWAGYPPVFLPVRLAIAYPGGGTVAGTLPRVFLSPGWG
jgi:hypothetical protein